ncbi:MAG: hypothetical protein D6776_08435, partial [Planctomycetota bacterium]
SAGRRRRGGRAGLVAVLLVGAVFATPATLAADEPDPLLAEAREALETGAYREAARGLEALLAEPGPPLEALDLWVRVQRARGRIRSLREQLTAWARGEDGASPAFATEAALALGELLVDLDPPAALPWLDKVLAKRPDDLRARAARLAWLVWAGRREQARAEWLRAVEAFSRDAAAQRDPASLRAMARIAQLAELLPSLAERARRPFAEQARELYQRAWEASGRRDPSILVEWAALYLRKWDLPEARRLLRKALERDPRRAEAHALLAESLLEDLYGGAERYDEARREIALALATDPGLPRALLLEGELRLGDGLYDEARQRFERALERAPRSPRALAGKLAALVLAGKSAQARALRAELDRSLSSTRRAELLRRLAAALDSRFRYREAYDAARAAVAADALYPPAWGRLGLSALRTGDLEAARTFLDKAHAADPYDLFVFNALELLDLVQREFVSFETEHFRIRMHRDELPWLRPYLETECERAWGELSRRWGVTLDTRIALEVYPNLQDFSVRAVGHRFIPASGVTFWRTVILASPAAFPPGAHGWAQVLWHELAHVASLERSGYRVPRWFTEGLSVYEESLGDPRWGRAWDAMLLDAIARDRIMPLAELDAGFSRPRFPGQVMLGYYQGGMICHYVAQRFGQQALGALLDGYREGLALEPLCERVFGEPSRSFDRKFLAWLRKRLGVERYRARCDDASELARLRRRARRHRRDPAALARYGLACCDMGRWADAEIVAGRLEALDPMHPDARLIEGRIAAHREHPKRALQLLAEAIALGCSDPIGAHRQRARLLLGLEKPAEALRELEAANRLFPRSLELLQQRAQLYEQLGKPEQARALEAEIARLQPDAFPLWMRLGKRAAEAGDWKQARYWLEQVPRVEPRALEAHAWLAEALARTGGPQRAIARELEVLAVLDKDGKWLARTRRRLAELKAPDASRPVTPTATARPRPPEPERGGPRAPSATAVPRRRF